MTVLCFHSDQDLKLSPEQSTGGMLTLCINCCTIATCNVVLCSVNELMVARKQARLSLKKVKSLPSAISKDDVVEEEEDVKQTHHRSTEEV